MQNIKLILRIVWQVLKSAIFLVLLFVLFRWVGFSIEQSVILMLLVVSGYIAYQTLKGKASAGDSFEPFRVVVLPKFAELLLDYKLLKDDESAKTLHSFWEKKDQRVIAFTILKYQASGDPLVYSDTDHCFMNKIELDEPVPAIVFRSVFDREPGESVSFRDPCEPSDNWRRSPSFYFGQTIGGYERGLKVEQRWWDQLCAEHPAEEFAKTKVDYNHLIGEARLTIAIIPYAAFAVFYTGQNYERFNRVWEELDSKIAPFGWKRHKQDEGAEMRDPWIRIEHKYFHVQYKEI